MSIELLSDQDNLLLRAWRRGELDEAKALEFETRLFFEPALLEAAKLDQALEACFREAPALLAGNASGKTWRRHWERGWPLLLAASVGALAVLPFRHADVQSPVLGNVEWVAVDVRRNGGTETPFLVAPRDSADLVVIEIPAPRGATGPFRLRLTGLDDRQVALELDKLQAADGVLSLAFTRDALAAGVYRVELAVAGERSAFAPTDLSFRYQP